LVQIDRPFLRIIKKVQNYSMQADAVKASICVAGERCVSLFSV